MASVSIELPKYTPRQQEIVDTALRDNMLLLSRRFGKTTLSKALAAEKAIEIPGYRVAWSVPAWKFVIETFEEFIDLLGPITARLSRDEKRIKLINGSLLEFWSSDNPSAGRGRKYHRWVADEIQEQSQLRKFIYGSVKPTLADLRGELWLLGTPNGEGSEFHELYLNWCEQIEKGERTKIHTGTLYENPHIHPDEIELLKRQLTPTEFAQEILAQWVRIDGVAPLIYKSLWDSLALIPVEFNRSKKILALDAAQYSDKCALTAVWRDKDTHQYYTDEDDVLLFEQRTNEGEYDFVELEKLIWRKWQTQQYYAFTYDPNQAVMLAQMLRRKGVRCIQFTQTNMRTKADSFLKQCLANGTYHHPDHPDLTEHFLNATLKYATNNSGLRIIKSGKTKNIDLAVATSMAIYQHSLLGDQMVADYVPAYAENVFVNTNSDNPMSYVSQYSPFGR